MWLICFFNLYVGVYFWIGVFFMLYGVMIGISFINGGGFFFEGKFCSVKWGNGGMMGSFGVRFYGDVG